MRDGLPVIRRVVHRPLRLCVAGLCLVGTSLATFAAVRAFPALGTGAGLVFTAVAVLLTVLAGLVLAGVRFALWLAVLGFAGQLAAVAGTALELAYGIDAGKAAQLRRLGFAPAAGVTVNLVYSAAMFAAFGWMAVRWWGLRRAGSAGTSR